MDDVITGMAPPSRILLEDLNNFTPPMSPLPSPFLVLSPTNSKNTLRPSLLIIAMSSPSLHFLHHLSPKTLIGTLVLPETPFAGNSLKPSPKDKSCNIYTLDGADKLIMIVLVQVPVTSERAHVVARKLIGEMIVPERVLILDSVQRRNFHGRLSSEKSIAFKLETSVERESGEKSSLAEEFDYFPSGSVLDGVGAALLSRCEMMRVKGTLCVSWPDLGGPVMKIVRSLLLKDVLSGIDYVVDEDYQDEYLRLSRRKDRLDSDLYT